MRIGIRKSHTKKSYGAVDFLDEWVESRNLYPRVVELLSKYHTIIDCTPSEQLGSGEWNTGVKIANESNLDLFFSLHFNSASGNPQGVETCVYPTDITGASYGTKICANISMLGFKNRGVKNRSDLAETKNIKCPSIVIETCFVQKSDGELYKKVGIEKIARAIANAIDSRISLDIPQTPSQTTPQASSSTSNTYRVRLSWNTPNTQIGAYSNLNNAINEAKKHNGYKVYDKNGKQVYPEEAKTKLVKSYSEKGLATVTGASKVNVRNSYNIEENNIVASYNKNEKFYYDYVYITQYNGKEYVWCSYISNSGVRRYCCAREDKIRYLTCV